jgi:hypothetical protein
MSPGDDVVNHAPANERLMRNAMRALFALLEAWGQEPEGADPTIGVMARCND